MDHGQRGSRMPGIHLSFLEGGVRLGSVAVSACFGNSSAKSKPPQGFAQLNGYVISLEMCSA